MAFGLDVGLHSRSLFWFCTGCTVFCCICLSLCWHENHSQGFFYEEITDVYMLVMLGVALGVWLFVKKRH